MKLALAAAATLAAALRCGPVPVEARLVPAGRYDYTATFLPPGSRDSVTLRGTFVLDSARADSLVGRWDVPGVESALADNYFNVVSYHVVARLQGGDSLTLVHAIRGGSGSSAPGCRVAVTRRGYWSDGRCTLTPAAPRPAA